MTITHAQAGFLKGLGLVILAAVASFLADSANLHGLLNPAIATLVAAFASSLESHIKSRTNNALFGAVAVR